MYTNVYVLSMLVKRVGTYKDDTRCTLRILNRSILTLAS
jgi:hypothetical protein